MVLSVPAVLGFPAVLAVRDILAVLVVRDILAVLVVRGNLAVRVVLALQYKWDAFADRNGNHIGDTCRGWPTPVRLPDWTRVVPDKTGVAADKVLVAADKVLVAADRVLVAADKRHHSMGMQAHCHKLVVDHIVNHIGDRRQHWSTPPPDSSIGMHSHNLPKG